MTVEERIADIRRRIELLEERIENLLKEEK